MKGGWIYTLTSDQSATTNDQGNLLYGNMSGCQCQGKSNQVTQVASTADQDHLRQDHVSNLSVSKARRKKLQGPRTIVPGALLKQSNPGRVPLRAGLTFARTAPQAGFLTFFVVFLFGLEI